MIPSGAFAAAVLLALIPGWVFLKLRERRDAALPRNGLDELLEIFAVGLSTTGAALLVWVLLPRGWTTWLVDPQALADSGTGVLANNVRQTALTVGLVLLLALLLAAGASWVAGARTKSRFARVTVWTGALAEQDGKVRWMGLHLRDGRLIEGRLLAYPTGDGHERRDIALEAPIVVTEATVGSTRRRTDLSRVIFNEVDIKSITVRLVDPPTT